MNAFRKWWNETSWTLKIVFPFTLIVSVGAAIKTWIDFDLWRPASIQYVKKETGQLKPTLRDIQIDLAIGKLAQIEELLFKWKQELEKGAGDSSLIRSRIRELENTRAALNSQIETIKKLKE